MEGGKFASMNTFAMIPTGVLCVFLSYKENKVCTPLQGEMSKLHVSAGVGNNGHVYQSHSHACQQRPESVEPGQTSSRLRSPKVRSLRHQWQNQSGEEQRVVLLCMF